jgi:hypothetical protein
MGLETRGGRSYYYRKRRIGDRVISEYVGRGEFAQAIAALERLERDHREMERYLEGAKSEHVDQMLAAHQQFSDLMAGLAAGALLLAGYHTHHGQWRKRRGNED